jgi:hypothetical protein
LAIKFRGTLTLPSTNDYVEYEIIFGVKRDLDEFIKRQVGEMRVQVCLARFSRIILLAGLVHRLFKQLKLL